MKTAVSLEVNGRNYAIEVEPRRSLADALRDDCRLTGTHLGCEHGVCGACTVLVDGVPVRACLMFALQAQGKAIRTVEGLADGDELHPLQQAFWEAQAVQCGFCTPGFLMTARVALEERSDWDREELRERLAGNLCRCTGYQTIVDAVLTAQETMRGSGGEDAR
jgi:carbon-monoxide dehydrogenase small subunit